MADVGGKEVTARRALARGTLKMGRRAFGLLQAGALPKGDALKAGELAGILAVKSTPQLLPLCHPLPIDAVSVRFEADARLPGVHGFCEVLTRSRTGVEMEALCGVTTALLAVYDLVKPVDAALEITEVRLEFKDGGKKGAWSHPKRSTAPRPLRTFARGRASVITVSDRCFRKQAVDRSGPLLATGLKRLGLAVAGPVVVPDELDAIAAAIRKAARRRDLVALTGGTGLGPRDVTPEALVSVCERLIPGFGEALRASNPGLPSALLSRGLAGQFGRCLVVALPGSPGGVADGLRVLEGVLAHALHTAAGGGHP